MCWQDSIACHSWHKYNYIITKLFKKISPFKTWISMTSQNSHANLLTSTEYYFQLPSQGSWWHDPQGQNLQCVDIPLENSKMNKYSNDNKITMIIFWACEKFETAFWVPTSKPISLNHNHHNHHFHHHRHHHHHHYHHHHHRHHNHHHHQWPYSMQEMLLACYLNPPMLLFGGFDILLKQDCSPVLSQ